jgi:uncharacterized protein (DUF488 family)
MEVYTIGFTQSSARHFFERLKDAGVRQLVDIRLNNRSQLAGFAKQDDLAYFLATICDMEYRHVPDLAPSKELLDDYKKGRCGWDEFRDRFLQLLVERRVATGIDPSLFAAPTVLMCSEPTAEHCHRRLVLEYLNDQWGDVRAIHL